jgi:hypothetical protein
MASFAPVTIYYWGMFGRAGAAMRMLEHVGAPYEHISDMSKLASVCSAFGCSATDNFAPPLLVDGEEFISQSSAVALHVGNKHGLNEGIKNPAKALQYMADIIDVLENGIGQAKGQGGAALKAYLEGDRLKKLMDNLERGIVGPFYFGAKPTYVDFLLVSIVDWTDATWADRLKAEKGVDVWGAYAKFSGVVSGIRGLDSYKGYSGTNVTANPQFHAKDDLFADYK